MTTQMNQEALHHTDNGAYPTTLLMIAIDQQSIDKIKLLLAAGADVSRVVRGQNALHRASMILRGDEILNTLMPYIDNQTLNSTVGPEDLAYNGMTALHLAASGYGRGKNAKILLEHGIDINAIVNNPNSEYHNQTALQIAHNIGNIAVIRAFRNP
jgi:ankyrin repeat protein